MKHVSRISTAQIQMQGHNNNSAGDERAPEQSSRRRRRRRQSSAVVSDYWSVLLSPSLSLCFISIVSNSIQIAISFPSLRKLRPQKRFPAQCFDSISFRYVRGGLLLDCLCYWLFLPLPLALIWNVFLALLFTQVPLLVCLCICLCVSFCNLKAFPLWRSCLPTFRHCALSLPIIPLAFLHPSITEYCYIE